jgi:hypothetical protein
MYNHVSKGKQQEKHKVHVGIDDFYKYYCYSTFKERKDNKTKVHHNSIYSIDRGVYTRIIGDFNSAISEAIMFDNFEYKLPARMGTLSIKKKKRKVYFLEDGTMVNRMPIDWKSTLELWSEDEESKEQKKLLRHTNEHTNGYIPFWYLNVHTGNFTNKTVYKFKSTRTNKRALAQILKDPSIKVNYYLK